MLREEPTSTFRTLSGIVFMLFLSLPFPLLGLFERAIVTSHWQFVRIAAALLGELARSYTDLLVRMIRYNTAK